jgi:Sulfotransferase family
LKASPVRLDTVDGNRARVNARERHCGPILDGWPANEWSDSGTAMPTFLVIGAAKAGTTALYHYLRQHPQVFMSRIKETNFFAFDYEGWTPLGGPRADVINRDRCNLRAYQALFKESAGEAAIGEASPRYMFTTGTAERIRRRLPSVRIVAILRDPAERAFSNFLMYKRDGFEPCATLAEAIADEGRRLRENWAYCTYVQIGMYAAQLQEYYDCFPQDQIKICLYEDFLENPGRLLKTFFGFIGVDDNFLPDMSTRHNISGIIGNPVLRFIWTRTHLVRSKLPTPKPIRQQVARLFTSQRTTRVPFPEETRRQLRDIYRDDILRLEKLIHRDLSAWLR